jgi:hypothetical protein
MLNFLRGMNKADSKELSKDTETPERLSEEMTVYTTEYGTQYVLPTDALFSREEKRQLLEEAEERAKKFAQENGKK